MKFGIVCVLVFLHCTLGYPAEQETIEYREWVPSRAAYGRDFENWFDWVPVFGVQERVKTPSLKERVETLEKRQTALFNLVWCESYNNADCTLFRTQAETIFEVPSRVQENLIIPTKVFPNVTPLNQGLSPNTLVNQPITPVSQASTATNGTPAPVNQVSSSDQQNLIPLASAFPNVTPPNQVISPNTPANQPNTPVTLASTAANGTPAPVNQASTVANTTPAPPSTTQAVDSSTVQASIVAASSEASAAANNQA